MSINNKYEDALDLVLYNNMTYDDFRLARCCSVRDKERIAGRTLLKAANKNEVVPLTPQFTFLAALILILSFLTFLVIHGKTL